MSTTHLPRSLFRDSVDRVRWADKRTHRVQREFARLPDEAKAVYLGQEFDPNEKRISVFVAREPIYPARWPLLISEALHHWRAALDHLVWQLALWNLGQQGKPGKPYKRTQYPIVDTADSFDKVSYMYRDIHPDHVTLLKELQAYGDAFVTAERQKYPHAPLQGIVRSHPLTILRDLNDHDKHRTLTLVAASGGRIDFVPKGYVDCTPGSYFLNRLLLEFNEGAEWRSIGVIPNGPEPKVIMDDRIFPELSIGGGHQALRLLPEISVAVGWVLTRFFELPLP